MSDSDADVQEYVMPGSENTQFFQVADPSGDAEAAADDEKFSVAGVIIVIFSIAILAAASIFYLLYVTEKRKREKREAAKLAGSSRNSMSASQSNRNSSNAANHATSAAAAAANAESRQKQINEGLIVQIWGSEVHPSDDESKEDEESGSDSNRDTCPICRKAYEAGDEVCSSRSQACGHSFHKSCISNWLQYQTRCPVCNTEYLSADATLS